MGVVTAGSAVGAGWSHWRVIGAGLAIALVSWVVLIRPEASIRQHGVLFRNMVRDVFIPSSKIEAAHASQTLMVRADAVTYHSPAVTRSARSQMREKHGRASLFGVFGGLGGSTAHQPSPSEYRYGEELQSATSYESYVESQIIKASRDAVPDDRDVVISWAWAPLAALAVSVIGVAVMFL
jgi:hypothetical protein